MSADILASRSQGLLMSSTRFRRCLSSVIIACATVSVTSSDVSQVFAQGDENFAKGLLRALIEPQRYKQRRKHNRRDRFRTGQPANSAGAAANRRDFRRTHRTQTDHRCDNPLGSTRAAATSVQPGVDRGKHSPHHGAVAWQRRNTRCSSDDRNSRTHLTLPRTGTTD